jgi:transcriptional regulator with XRE-family HTH domain
VNIAVLRYNINMDFFTRIEQGKWTAYRLSKESGIPLTTVNDLLTRKTDPHKLSFETAHKLAETFRISLDQLYRDFEETELNSNYDALRSEICHQLKDQGDMEFLDQLLSSDQVEKLYKRRLYFHCFYLVGLCDYLCRIHQLPLPKEYEEIRSHKLRKSAVPLSLEMLEKIDPKNPEILRAKTAAIPEFARFNILEGNVRDAL